MGTYLSTPITEKGEESGEDLSCPVTPLVWGVVDMQGWRKSMEDAHVADTYVSQGKAKVFAVFDGHGGPEVARFCQLYLVDVLTKQPTWNEDTPDDSSVGQALVDAFHALDRMIDQGQDELVRLRMEKPMPGERRIAGFIPAPPLETTSQQESTIEVKVELDKTHLSALESHNEIAEEDETDESTDEDKVDNRADDDQTSISTEEDKQVDIAEEGETGGTTENDKADEQVVLPEDTEVQNDQLTDVSEEVGMDDIVNADGDAELPLDANGDGEETPAGDSKANTIAEEDDDSNEAVGKEEAAEMDQDFMTDEAEGDEPDMKKGQAPKVTIMFQKLLSLGGNAGQVVAKVTTNTGQATTDAAQPASLDVPPPFAATVVHNGRQICNLPDHPIHAGCTAIVAVLIGRTLTIANAGDSRAVLCRVGGKAEPLSFDHKPHQDREMNRITSAGGFVNQFGRVNGNLNLSRSIGDLKYKQVPGIIPAEQMITAEPDIVQVTLHAKDEFFILGCDGIWDCLTNDQAVKYVRDRIDTMTPVQIGNEMLDEIISEDPRATQGIGGDNMTIMIVDLQPEKRAYR